MAYIPPKNKQRAAVVPLNEDLKALGLRMSDVTRSTEGVTPVIGNNVRSADQLLSESRRAALTPAQRKKLAEAKRARAKKAAKMEAVRRKQQKLREGTKRTAGSKWLKMYSESKTGRFATRRSGKSPLSSLVEDVQSLISGVAGRKHMAESVRREYRRAFRNVAEVAEMLARKYERGGVKGESTARMLRKMKAEAVRHYKRLGEAENAYEPRDIDADPEDANGETSTVGKNANPNPNDKTAEGELDLQDPSGDLGGGSPGAPEDMGDEEDVIDVDPEDALAAEDIDLQDPSGDIGKGKQAGGPTPTGDEPDWIDPDLRDELNTYVGEDDEDPTDSDDDDADDDAATEDDEDPTDSDDDADDADDDAATEDDELPVDDTDLPTEDDADPTADDTDDMGDLDAGMDTEDDADPMAADADGGAPAMSDEDAADGDPAPVSKGDDAEIKEMMKALVTALDDYTAGQEKTESRRRRARR